MGSEIKKRLEWVKVYEAIGNAGIVCLKCNITRPTLRKWFKRYKVYEIGRLNELIRIPHKIHYKITKEDERRILGLRINRNLGHRSIVSEMKRVFESSYSTATVHKVFKEQ